MSFSKNEVVMYNLKAIFKPNQLKFKTSKDFVANQIVHVHSEAVHATLHE